MVILLMQCGGISNEGQVPGIRSRELASQLLVLAPEAIQPP